MRCSEPHTQEYEVILLLWCLEGGMGRHQDMAQHGTVMYYIIVAHDEFTKSIWFSTVLIHTFKKYVTMIFPQKYII